MIAVMFTTSLLAPNAIAIVTIAITEMVKIINPTQMKNNCLKKEMASLLNDGISLIPSSYHKDILNARMVDENTFLATVDRFVETNSPVILEE